MPLPVSLVIGLAGEPGDLLVNRIARRLWLDERCRIAFGVGVVGSRFRALLFLFRLFRVEHRGSIIAVHQAEKNRGRQIHETGLGLVFLTPDERLVFRAVGRERVNKRPDRGVRRVGENRDGQPRLRTHDVGNQFIGVVRAFNQHELGPHPVQ
jgi:hypothetical protein